MSRWFGGGVAASALTSNVLPFPTQLPNHITPPWSESELPQYVYEDIFGNAGPVTRSQAMKVAGVGAARALILGTVAPAPLRALRGDELLSDADQPTWLYRTNGKQSPQHRMAHTLDDLIFHGDALWTLERGVPPSEDKPGTVLHANYCPRRMWKIDADTADILLLVDLATDTWRVADRFEVAYFPAFFEGLLEVGADTIRGALDLERNWRNQARVPLPGLILQEREDNGMTPDEMQKWVAAVAENRRKPDGAVMGLPARITATMSPVSDPQLLIEGRNAVKLDIANHLGINPSAIGAALPKASLNYETQEGTRQEFVSRMDFFTSPIEATLSGSDFVPEGQRVRFDFNPTPHPALTSTGPTMED